MDIGGGGRTVPPFREAEASQHRELYQHASFLFGAFAHQDRMRDVEVLSRWSLGFPASVADFFLLRCPQNGMYRSH